MRGTQSSGMQLRRGFIPPVSAVGKATLGLGCISGSPEVGGGTGGRSLGERATALRANRIPFFVFDNFSVVLSPQQRVHWGVPTHERGPAAQQTRPDL